jgi:hypothetical protein
VRLRPLTEEECYARCYGGRREESVSVVRTRQSGDLGTSDRSADEADQAEASEAA